MIVFAISNLGYIFIHSRVRDKLKMLKDPIPILCLVLHHQLATSFFHETTIYTRLARNTFEIVYQMELSSVYILNIELQNEKRFWENGFSP